MEETMEVGLAKGEKVLTNYAEWRSRRGLSPSAVGAAILLLLLSAAFDLAYIALATVVGFAVYAFYCYFVRPVESGEIFRTNRRLIFLRRRQGMFLREFIVDTIRLDAIVGVDTFEGELLLRGGRRVSIGPGVGEQVLCDILEARYAR